MRFDDRLATVLHQPVGDAHDRAVRWRQLVDLVSRAGRHADSPVLRESLDLIRTDSQFVPEHLRAAAARAISASSMPIELLRYFASEPVVVAAPVLSAVQLDDDQWRMLLRDASPEIRGLIGTLNPQLGTEAPQAPRETQAAPSIGDVIARIERLREARERPAAPAPAAAPADPAPRKMARAAVHGEARLFRWECDPSGEIAWVEGAPRGALIGRSIARREAEEGVDEGVERAFAMRAPFRDGELAVAGEGPVAGAWKISGIPAFNDGRFAGYRGVAVRESANEQQVAPKPSSLPVDPDSLRELVHELKTPLNAIIGFAEIIERQMLGPADENYRARAGEIVTQARLLLAAIDDLDLAAKLQAEPSRRGPGADLSGLLEAIVDDLAELAAARGAWLDVEPPSMPLITNVEPALAQRLVRRFCGSIVDRAGQGERLHAKADRSGDFCRVAISQPRALASDRNGAVPQLELRLVRGLARVIGGDVSIEQGSVVLALPAA